MGHTAVVESQAESSWRSVTTVAVGAAVGPVAVILYETGRLDLFRATPLLNIWLVVICGLLGVAVGVAAVRRRIILAGVICLITNAAVFGLYGFLAAFFSFGGSR